MSFDSTPSIGLPTHILNQVEQKLQKPVSRELHAFCHLSPPDSPAAVELLRLSQDELLQFSGNCKEAINQWCCCARDYEAQPDGPSLTTRNSTLIARVLLSAHIKLFSPRSNKRLLIISRQRVETDAAQLRQEMWEIVTELIFSLIV